MNRLSSVSNQSGALQAGLLAADWGRGVLLFDWMLFSSLFRGSSCASNGPGRYLTNVTLGYVQAGLPFTQLHQKA